MFKKAEKHYRITGCIRLDMFLLFMTVIIVVNGVPVHISAATGLDKSANVQQVHKRSIICGSEVAKPYAAKSEPSSAKPHQLLKDDEPSKPNHKQRIISALKFAEAEVLPSGDFSVADISALPRAPGSNLEVLNNPERVIVQLPAGEIEALVDGGVEVNILRNFILVEGSTNEADVLNVDLAALSCSGPNEYGANGLNVPIETDPFTWVGSAIDFSLVPGGYTVTCIDVHYEIESSWVGYVYAELSDEDYGSYTYPLVDGVNGSINQTETGITAFNGKPLAQYWILWAREEYSSGDGYIDYWWIKLYYGGGPGYCDASGGCWEYISRVQVGDIDNSSDCDGYADYTSTSTDMEIGTAYSITVTNGEPYEVDECGIWVDWNQDEDFDDADETISVSGTPGLGPYTATITPPVDAEIGDTRMRIRIIDSDYDTLNPCGTTSYGEVEDYTITVTSPGAYCDASGGCWEYISRVQVGDIDNSSGCDGYADYTAISTDMEIGTAYSITVTNGEPYEVDECGIWVDWNQDEDFDDADETISVSGTPGLGPYTATITPPVDAELGGTRMRIRIIDSDYNTLNPCGTTSYGEVEDYTITVTSPTPPPITISGYVKKSDGTAVSGVLLTASTGQSDTTNESGYYELELPELWSGIITPTKTNYRFTPLNRTYTNVSTDMPNQNFMATPVIEASADAYVSYDFPTTNYGTETKLTIGKKGGAGYTIYLKFDLSSIPPNQAIFSARLHLYAYQVSTTSPGISPQFVSDDSWEETEITDDNAPPSSAESTPTVVTTVVPGDNYWDVSTRVDQSYITDGIYSVHFIYVTSSASEYYADFASREHPTPSWRPYLEIVYEEPFCGGTGTLNDPYLICTGEQMNNIGRLQARWSRQYKLVNDISLAAYTGTAYNIIGTSPPQTGSRTPFRGVFDGDYHSISDFSYSSSSDKNYVGLFGYIYEATVKNLKVISPNITDTGYDDLKCVGALAGYASSSDISGCSVFDGTVEGKEYVGGLVGIAQGYIANCSSSASVSGGNEVGGLVGTGSVLGGATIADSYAQGAVSGGDHVGGFIGDSSDMIITNCYSTGTVIGDSNVGGFSGYNENQYPIIDNVTGCFWDVESSGEPNSAAGTPLPTADMYNETTFTDSGWDFVGELANGGSDDWAMPPGGGYPVIWYQLSPWPALPSFAAGSGTEEDPYEISTELELNSIGHNPRLMDKHFKLINDINMAGMKYYMIANKPYVFTGTFDGLDHTISNISIESEFDTSPSGFIANIYGSGTSIQNLTLDEPNIVSTWGWRVGSLTGLNETGTITNCHAVNANVVGMLGVGGLVGVNYQYGKISGCSATGNVSENNFMSIIFSPVGGLVGENTFWSEIENSFAKCSVSGDDCVGGLVGSNLIYSPVTNCYSQGSVSGTEDYIGGLIGRNYGGTDVNYCYSSSLVSGPAGTDAVGGFIGKMGTTGREYYKACFWDSEVNPDVNGIGNVNDPNVIGKTTAEMQTQSTFTDAGWDFINETINGTEDIWCLISGHYPCFAWEGVSPKVVSWEIGATHGGSVGEIWCEVNDGYVEPRTYGIAKLCVCFDTSMDISVADPNVISIEGVNGGIQPPPCLIEWVDSNFCMVITLCSALPDEDTYTITLKESIKSEQGVAIEETSICLTALNGDANGNRSVNSGDLLAIRSHINQPVDCSNARYDINCSGSINSGDLLAARSSIPNGAPACP